MESLVRRYYEIGRELNDPSSKARAKRSEPDTPGISGPSSASKRVYENEYRRFAALYTPEELEELLKLRTTKDSMPLGWGIIRKLMAVPEQSSAQDT